MWADVDEDDDAQDTKLISRSIGVTSNAIKEADSLVANVDKTKSSNQRPGDREHDVKPGFRRMVVVETDVEDPDSEADFDEFSKESADAVEFTGSAMACAASPLDLNYREGTGEEPRRSGLTKSASTSDDISDGADRPRSGLTRSASSSATLRYVSPRSGSARSASIIATSHADIHSLHDVVKSSRSGLDKSASARETSRRHADNCHRDELRFLEKLDKDSRALSMEVVRAQATVGNDSTECDSPPRVAEMAKLTGLTPWYSLDLTVKGPDGLKWDFTKARGRLTAWKRIKSDMPYLSIGSPL